MKPARGRGRPVEIVDGKRMCIQCRKAHQLSDFYVRVIKGTKRYDSRCDECRKISYIVRNRNASVAEYRRHVAASGGKCMICKADSKLSLDHCHTTGVLRGMLCQACNSGLGAFKDDIANMRNAVEYLLKYVEDAE